MVATGTYIYGQKGKEIKPESIEGTTEGYAKGPASLDGPNANNKTDSKEALSIGKGAGGVPTADIEMGA
jgi:hypothetical protein